MTHPTPPATTAADPSLEDLLAAAESALPALLGAIGSVVGVESPSADLAAVAHGAEHVAALGTGMLGIAPETLVVDGCTHLRWRLGGSGPRVLILCHQDTVWPHGTLQRLPFAIRDGVLTGPGSFDMKTGLVMAFHALQLLGAGGNPGAGVPAVTVLVTGDEEIGSPTSRGLIEQEAATAAATFVLEASGDGGRIKTGRKGVSMYQVSVTGRASHAGLEPEKGINAGVELARLILQMEQFADPAAGTSVVPTAATIGTTGNTVPAHATVSVDSRAWTADEQQRVDAAIRSLRTAHPEATLEIGGGINRPPMERAQAQRLFQLAGELATGLGLPALQEISVGGGSDGNFTAGVGCPTLDGLGAVGGGAHADTEHVLVEEIAGRTALLAALIRSVCAGSPTR